MDLKMKKTILRHRFQLNRFRDFFHTERNTGGMTVITSTICHGFETHKHIDNFFSICFVERQRAMLDAENRRQQLVRYQIHPDRRGFFVGRNIFLVLIHRLTFW